MPPDVAVVILAAGRGARLGPNYIKPLLPWQGGTLLSHAIDTALSSQARRTVVVLGHAAETVARTMTPGRVTVVVNADWAMGMMASMQAAVRSLPDGVAAAVFMLVDQPRVEPALLDAVIARWRTTRATLVAPQFEGQFAPPALIDRRRWPELMQLRGDVGGRVLFRQHLDEVAWVEWPVDVRPDIDTVDDYIRLAGHRPDAPQSPRRPL